MVGALPSNAECYAAGDTVLLPRCSLSVPGSDNTTPSDTDTLTLIYAARDIYVESFLETSRLSLAALLGRGADVIVHGVGGGHCLPPIAIRCRTPRMEAPTINAY